MDEYGKMVRGQRKWMFFLIAILIIGLIVTPYKPLLLGFLLGSVVSAFNLWFLQSKVEKFGKAIIGGKSVVSLGTFTRMVTSALAIAIALQFEENIHIYATVLGLVSSYVVMLIDSFVRAVIEAKRS